MRNRNVKNTICGIENLPPPLSQKRMSRAILPSPPSPPSPFSAPKKNDLLYQLTSRRPSYFSGAGRMMRKAATKQLTAAKITYWTKSEPVK